MRMDYPKWLEARQYSDNTRVAQLNRVKKVEECYGNLDDHYVSGTYQAIIDSLQYSTADERANRPNPSKIKFEGNIRNNLQSYKNAVVRYLKFLNDPDSLGDDNITINAENYDGAERVEQTDNLIQQRFSLERDMQTALRANIASLDPSLRIVDDGAERAVASGMIDITCEDETHLVVVELKAGRADSRSIGQILGYMGDLMDEEGGRPVRGILVANDFDKRATAASRVVPNLKLKKYAIQFSFSDHE